MSKIEKLREEEEGEEEGAGEVRYPEKGKDYVVLPTADTPNAEDQARGQRRRRTLMVIGGILAILIIIIIVVCLVLFLSRPKGKKDDEGDDGEEEVTPEDSGRLTCNLAGMSPTNKRCKATGCELLSMGDDKIGCVYPESGQYIVSSIKTTNTKTYITIVTDDTSRRRRRSCDDDDHCAPPGGDDDGDIPDDGLPDDGDDEEGDVEEVKSYDKPLAVIPKTLHVGITHKIDSLGIQISKDNLTSSEGEEEDEGEPISSTVYRLKTAAKGDKFFITVYRLHGGDVKEAVFDTTGQPLVVTKNLVELVAVVGGGVRSGGRSISSGDSLAVWNSAGNSALPFFHGTSSSSSSSSSSHYGVAVDSPSPMKLSFNEHEGEMRTSLVMLGGDVVLEVFMGPSMADMVAQVTKKFGGPFKAPWWSLGSLVTHSPLTRLNSSTFKIDVVVLEEMVKDVDPSQNLITTLEYVSPQIFTDNQDDPPIRDSEGASFLGTTHQNMAPGSYYPYVDYTHSYSDMDTSLDGLYARERDNGRPGVNLRKNYPLNYADLGCEDDIYNTSPFVNITDTPLYQDTICLDFLHDGELGLVKHIDIHNIYGKLQAKIFYEWLTGAGNMKYFQKSDSVSLGAGQYTAKTVDINDSDDIRQIVKLSQWYGMLGMHMVTVLTPSFKSSPQDQEVLVNYHRTNAFLPFTSVDEEAISKLSQPSLGQLKKSLEVKNLLYPEWLNLLYQAHDSGLPIVRCASFNFPGQAGKLDPDQFMLGGKILVAGAALLGTGKEVYLPDGETWYRKALLGSSYEKVKSGLTTVDPAKPMQLFFVRGSSVLMTTKQLQMDRVSGNMIETVKKEEINIMLFLTKELENIEEVYYLTENNEDELKVTVNVTSNSTGVFIDMTPGGPALLSKTDERSWNLLSIANGGLRGPVSKVLINSQPLTGLEYSYKYSREDPASSILKLTVEDNKYGSPRPTFHTKYTIQVLYEDP